LNEFEFYLWPLGI